MKSNNVYVLYKQDTRLLLYWMIKSSNAIIQSLDAAENDSPLQLNVTGQVTVSELVHMSELIAKHRTEIPSAIFGLFQSVIELRSIYYSQFQHLASVSPNEELERSNSTHKYFIDTLTKAFDILGGQEWLSKEQEKQVKSGEEASSSNIFATTNKFSVLDLNSDSESDDSDNEKSDKETSSVVSPQQKRRRQSDKGKRKKGKGKKANRGRKPSRAADQSLDEVPLESYRIIEDDEMTEYVMAVLALTRDWIQLRSLLQDIWRRVAFRNLNSAVAATLAKVAVAMVKQSEATIFVDFPGYESFEMIKQTLTRGDVEKAEKEYRLIIQADETNDAAKVTEVSLDVKELFLINTFDDFVDFITDYQKTRSGKPTKRMLAQLDNWDPRFNLQAATKQERIKWRRCYTINWLYDLVNMTACAALFGEDAKGEGIVLEKMDWSDNGSLKSCHRMFGLIDFAAEVTALAMQKPGIAFSHKIPPHLVFYLQCIIDSWTISRGWAISGVNGHIISEPAHSFQPRRDLDIFLGRGIWGSSGRGFFQGTRNLKAGYLRLQSTARSLEHTLDCIGILEKLGYEFTKALGKCDLFRQLSAVLPSRFSTTNPNGAWDYSPFLCGAGLAEALELTYRSVMVLWDGMREPMLILHLHNMLVERGFLRPLPMYTRLDSMFSESFYYEGKRPKRDFIDTFQVHVNKMITRKEFLQERTNRRAAPSVTHTREFLNLVVLRLFKQKSILLQYSEADWDPSRIPDCDTEPMSALGMIRLAQTKLVRNSAEFPWQLEETELVKRALAAGVDELFIIALDPLFEKLRNERQATLARMTLCIPDCASTQLSWLQNTCRAPSRPTNDDEEVRDSDLTAEIVLSMLWNDIHGDLSGGLRPLSSLDYLWITARILQYFEELEKEAETTDSAIVRALYSRSEVDDSPCSVNGDKILLISLRALDGEDPELLKTMAKTFEGCGGSLTDMVYWPEEETVVEATDGPVARPGGDTDCCVM